MSTGRRNVPQATGSSQPLVAAPKPITAEGSALPDADKVLAWKSALKDLQEFCQKQIDSSYPNADGYKTLIDKSSAVAKEQLNCLLEEEVKNVPSFRFHNHGAPPSASSALGVDLEAVASDKCPIDQVGAVAAPFLDTPAWSLVQEIGKNEKGVVDVNQQVKMMPHLVEHFQVLLRKFASEVTVANNKIVQVEVPAVQQKFMETEAAKKIQSLWKQKRMRNAIADFALQMLATARLAAEVPRNAAVKAPGVYVLRQAEKLVKRIDIHLNERGITLESAFRSVDRHSTGAIPAGLFVESLVSMYGMDLRAPELTILWQLFASPRGINRIRSKTRGPRGTLPATTPLGMMYRWQVGLPQIEHLARACGVSEDSYELLLSNEYERMSIRRALTKDTGAVLQKCSRICGRTLQRGTRLLTDNKQPPFIVNVRRSVAEMADQVSKTSGSKRYIPVDAWADLREAAARQVKIQSSKGKKERSQHEEMSNDEIMSLAKKSFGSMWEAATNSWCMENAQLRNQVPRRDEKTTDKLCPLWLSAELLKTKPPLLPCTVHWAAVSLASWERVESTGDAELPPSSGSTRGVKVQFGRAMPGNISFAEARLSTTLKVDGALPNIETVVIGNEGLQVRLIDVPIGPEETIWKVRYACGPMKGVVTFKRGCQEATAKFPYSLQHLPSFACFMPHFEDYTTSVDGSIPRLMLEVTDASAVGFTLTATNISSSDASKVLHVSWRAMWQGKVVPKTAWDHMLNNAPQKEATSDLVSEVAATGWTPLAKQEFEESRDVWPRPIYFSKLQPKTDPVELDGLSTPHFLCSDPGSDFLSDRDDFTLPPN